MNAKVKTKIGKIKVHKIKIGATKIKAVISMETGIKIDFYVFIFLNHEKHSPFLLTKYLN